MKIMEWPKAWLLALSLLAGMVSAQQAPGEEQQMAAGGILVFGASRGTGLEATRLLAARGEQVTAFVRPTSRTRSSNSRPRWGKSTVPGR